MRRRPSNVNLQFRVDIGSVSAHRPTPMTPEQFVETSDLLLAIWRKHGTITAMDRIIRSPTMTRPQLLEALSDLDRQLRALAASDLPGSGSGLARDALRVIDRA
jgi:hypothetical protein